MITFDELMQDLYERKIMTVQQRRKMGIRMKKMMKNPAVQAKIARARMKKAPDAKIQQRANKASKTLIIKKFAGMDANAYANLSLQQRQIIDDKIMKTKAGAVKKIAKKMMPKLKKAELVRLSLAKKAKAEK